MAKVKFTNGGLNKTTINQYFLCQVPFYISLRDDPGNPWPRVRVTTTKNTIKLFDENRNLFYTQVELKGKFKGNWNDPIKKLKVRTAAEEGPWSGWTTFDNIKGLTVGDFDSRGFNSLRKVVLKGNDLITGSQKSEEVLHGYDGDDELRLYSGDEAYGGEGSDIFVLNKKTRKARIRDFNFGQDEIHIKNPAQYELSPAFGDFPAFGDYVVRHIQSRDVIAYVAGSSAGSTRDFKFNEAPWTEEDFDAENAYKTLLRQNT